MKVLGLFSGIGGFEEGLRRSGMEIAHLCEIEHHCRSVLRKNFPDTPITNSVHFVDPTGYDVICGGFPCQDISIAGKNKGIKDGKKSSLWRMFHRAIEEGRPKYAIIENVSALRGRGLGVILHDLAQIGYDACWTMLDSKYAGVPQRRRRVYILAVRDGIPEGADPLHFSERDSDRVRQQMEAVTNGFDWIIQKGTRGREAVTFYTRQRSDEFNTNGLSSTLAKRDYKSYTDLVVHGDAVRRVTPEERLLLQGFPRDWWDGCGLTDPQKFTCNGMTVPVVEYIGRCVMEFDQAYGTDNELSPRTA